MEAGTTVAKSMTRHERLLKLHGDGYSHLNPFAKAMSEMYVVQGLAECSAAFIAHDVAAVCVFRNLL